MLLIVGIIFGNSALIRTPMSTTKLSVKQAMNKNNEKKKKSAINYNNSYYHYYCLTFKLNVCF